MIAEIEGNEEIIVAVWKNNADLNHNKKVSEKCQGRQCQEPGRRDFGLGDAGIMVNLFPEKDEELFKKSPCWLDSDRKDGLLDAISKHFLLAQLAQGEGRTIADFNRNVWYEWTAEKVLYAGEIIVDLNNCTLDVNGNSGTYRPKISYRPLNEVGVRFDDLLSSEEILSGVC